MPLQTVGEDIVRSYSKMTNINQGLVYFLTGSLAGACSATTDFGFDKISAQIRGTPSRSMQALVQSMLPHLVRPGLRFWGFDLAKRTLLPESLPVSLQGGLAGATGGFLEMASANAYAAMKAHSSKRSTLEVMARTTLLHSGKLFLCFGSYTYLANTFSESLPPKPFPYCLFLGAVAGAFGTTSISPLEMYTASKVRLSLGQVIRTAISRAPRGAVGVGTVIAVQVTSSAWILERA